MKILWVSVLLLAVSLGAVLPAAAGGAPPAKAPPKPSFQELEKAIQANPSDSSPYFALGEMSAGKGRSIDALFYFLRFVSLEPGSARSIRASGRVFELLTSGVSAGGDGNVTISLSPDFDSAQGDFAALEMARTLAASTIHLEEARSQSKAQRYVSALDTFLSIAEETAAGESGITSSFLWKRAAAPVLELRKRGLLECFGHVLALQAGFAGAQAWLDGHSQKRKELDTALAELRR